MAQEEGAQIPVGPFNPQGPGYDYASAKASGIAATPGEIGPQGWPDVDPTTGKVLVGTEDPSFPSTMRAQHDQGNQLRWHGGRMYSDKPPEVWEDPRYPYHQRVESLPPLTDEQTALALRTVKELIGEKNRAPKPPEPKTAFGYFGKLIEMLTPGQGLTAPKIRAPLAGPLYGKEKAYYRLLEGLEEKDPAAAAHFELAMEPFLNRARQGSRDLQHSVEDSVSGAERSVSTLLPLIESATRFPDTFTFGQLRRFPQLANKILGTDIPEDFVNKAYGSGILGERMEEGRNRVFVEQLMAKAEQQNPSGSPEEHADQAREWLENGSVPGWDTKLTNIIAPMALDFLALRFPLGAIGKAVGVGGKVAKVLPGIGKVAAGTSGKARLAQSVGHSAATFAAFEGLQNPDLLPESERTGISGVANRVVHGAGLGVLTGTLGFGARNLYATMPGKAWPAWVMDPTKANAFRESRLILGQNRLGAALDVPQRLESFSIGAALGIAGGEKDFGNVIAHGLTFMLVDGATPYTMGRPGMKSFFAVGKSDWKSPMYGELQREGIDVAHGAALDRDFTRDREVRARNLRDYKAKRADLRTKIKEQGGWKAPDSAQEALHSLETRRAAILKINAEKETYNRWAEQARAIQHQMATTQLVQARQNLAGGREDLNAQESLQERSERLRSEQTAEAQAQREARQALVDARVERLRGSPLSQRLRSVIEERDANAERAENVAIRKEAERQVDEEIAAEKAEGWADLQREIVAAEERYEELGVESPWGEFGKEARARLEAQDLIEGTEARNQQRAKDLADRRAAEEQVDREMEAEARQGGVEAEPAQQPEVPTPRDISRPELSPDAVKDTRAHAEAMERIRLGDLRDKQREENDRARREAEEQVDREMETEARARQLEPDSPVSEFRREIDRRGLWNDAEMALDVLRNRRMEMRRLKDQEISGSGDSEAMERMDSHEDAKAAAKDSAWQKELDETLQKMGQEPEQRSDRPEHIEEGFKQTLEDLHELKSALEDAPKGKEAEESQAAAEATEEVVKSLAQKFLNLDFQRLRSILRIGRPEASDPIAEAIANSPQRFEGAGSKQAETASARQEMTTDKLMQDPDVLRRYEEVPDLQRITDEIVDSFQVGPSTSEGLAQHLFDRQFHGLYRVDDAATNAKGEKASVEAQMRQYLMQEALSYLRKAEAKAKPRQQSIDELVAEHGESLHDGDIHPHDRIRAKAIEERQIQKAERAQAEGGREAQAAEAKMMRRVLREMKDRLPKDLWGKLEEALNGPEELFEVQAGLHFMDHIQRTQDLKHWKIGWTLIRQTLSRAGVFSDADLWMQKDAEQSDLATWSMLRFERELAISVLANGHATGEAGGPRAKARKAVEQWDETAPPHETIGLSPDAYSRRSSGVSEWATLHDTVALNPKHTQKIMEAAAREGYEGSLEDVGMWARKHSKSSRKETAAAINRAAKVERNRLTRESESKIRTRLRTLFDGMQQVVSLAKRGIGFGEGMTWSEWFNQAKWPAAFLAGAAALEHFAPGAGEVASAAFLGFPLFGKPNGIGKQFKMEPARKAKIIAKAALGVVKESMRGPSRASVIPIGGFKGAGRDQKGSAFGTQRSKIGHSIFQQLGIPVKKIGDFIERFGFDRELGAGVEIMRLSDRFFSPKGIFMPLIGRSPGKSAARDLVGARLDGFAKTNGGERLTGDALTQRWQAELRKIEPKYRPHVEKAVAETRKVLNDFRQRIAELRGVDPGEFGHDDYFHRVFRSEQERSVIDYIREYMGSRDNLKGFDQNAKENSPTRRRYERIPSALKRRTGENLDYSQDAVLSMQEYLPAMVKFIHDMTFRQRVEPLINGEMRPLSKTMMEDHNGVLSPKEGAYREVGELLDAAMYKDLPPDMYPRVAIKGELERFRVVEHWNPTGREVDGKRVWDKVKIELLGSGNKMEVSIRDLLHTGIFRQGGMKQMDRSLGGFLAHDYALKWMRKELGLDPSILDGTMIGKSIDWLSRFLSRRMLGHMNPGPMLNNSIGGQLLNMSELGGYYFALGTKDLAMMADFRSGSRGAKLRQEMVEAGVIGLGHEHLGFLTGTVAKRHDLVQGAHTKFNRTVKFLGKTVEGMHGFMLTEMTNRVIAYSGGKRRALDRFKEEGLNAEEAMMAERAGYNPYGSAAEIKAAENYTAHLEGYSVMGKVGALYASANTPFLLRNPLGRMALHLNRFQLHYMREVGYLAGGFRRGDQAAMAKTLRGTAMAAMLNIGANKLGQDVGSLWGEDIKDLGGVYLDFFTKKQGGLGAMIPALRGGEEDPTDLKDHEPDFWEHLGNTVLPMPQSFAVAAPIQTMATLTQHGLALFDGSEDGFRALGYEAGRVRDTTWDRVVPWWKTAREVSQAYQVEPIFDEIEIFGYKPEIPLVSGPDNPYHIRRADTSTGESLWEVYQNDGTVSHYTTEGLMKRALWAPGISHQLERTINAGLQDNRLAEKRTVERRQIRSQLIDLDNAYRRTGNPRYAKMYRELLQAEHYRQQDVDRYKERSQHPAWVRRWATADNNDKMMRLARLWNRRSETGISKHELRIALGYVGNPEVLGYDEYRLYSLLSKTAWSR